ncbi:MAG: CBS domain-containing protein [Bdellovibrionaceae bacterium]|nr:CBS domain-containing protein [Pseudobdellovibrionaceae bacterium]
MIEKKISHHMTEMPHTIGEGATVVKAREMMREFGYHHLPVLKGGTLVGIISERDLRVAELLNKDAETSIADIMSEEPYMVDHDADIKDVLAAMQKKGFSSVIVKGTKKDSWGIFTTTDAIRLLMATL